MAHFVTQAQSVPSASPEVNQSFHMRSLVSVLSLSTVMAVGVLSIASFTPQISAPAVAQSYPTLTIGTTGSAVSQLQATLTLLGFYTGEVNGTYDQSTVDAVTQFQATVGIFADGVTGPSTWQKLLPNPSDVIAAASQPSTAQTPPAAAPPAESNVVIGPPILRAEAEGPAVAQLQRELQTLGYYDGSIDGGFGEETLAAVEQFQADQQLFVDGVVGGATWDALSRALEGR